VCFRGLRVSSERFMGTERCIVCWLLDQLRLGDGSHSRRLGRSLIYRRMGLS